jgi:hypothetical protein
MTGRYDLTAIIAAIMAASKKRCRHLRVATLSFNAKNVDQLAGMLAGQVDRLTLLYSAFHREHSPEVCGELRRRFADEFRGRYRIAAARNHAKVVTMTFEGPGAAGDGRLREPPHEQQSGAGDGYPEPGAARLAFSLDRRDGDEA